MRCARLVQVPEDRALHQLAPQGPPEALDLAQRLGVPRARHDLPDAAPLAQLVEGALAAPGVVLRAVVGQDLLRRTEVGDRRLEHLAHQGPRCAGVQPEAHDEAAEVVQERHQVHAAVLALEHEGEQVGLPQLVGTRALEAP